MSARPLSPQQVQDFQRDGYLFVPTLLDAEETEFAPYDAIVLGLGRSAKENAQTPHDIVASLDRPQQR